MMMPSLVVYDRTSSRIEFAFSASLGNRIIAREVVSMSSGCFSTLSMGFSIRLSTSLKVRKTPAVLTNIVIPCPFVKGHGDKISVGTPQSATLISWPQRRIWSRLTCPQQPHTGRVEQNCLSLPFPEVSHSTFLWRFCAGTPALFQ